MFVLTCNWVDNISGDLAMCLEDLHLFNSSMVVCSVVWLYYKVRIFTMFLIFCQNSNAIVNIVCT